ncbi:UNVERIFIED_ORG: hypothetical protein M2438_000439 [Methylobacterium sp. SuP10 SLI 274]|uniref:hypothetical protein n=1 Tax=Methylorubrum extorquens TaxID=408 RepID=UPI0020A0A8D8|nr:hypothetical protein [Methylorubrum extorquens]MDF9861637.1 hypothetical protein [Methylorubrum pseudosasae]MDH6635264.1 hypothetical protein [Methylobacterium sp. SuP10 SLI 274]MDH6664434.1 hypothetical protein [Methylorubrum zatmanii]MCP1561435.1 hypothetical protein [Methylorubrum extorquens]MDF9789930.1 hypothetical protein [Methylorubrum extorquens]
MLQTAGVATTAAEFLGRHDNVFARSISDIKRAGLLSDAQRLGLSASAAEAAGLLARRSLFDPPYGAINSMMAMPLPPPRISAPFHQRPHEQEAFYLNLTVHRAVDTGALTCDIWRHKAGTEIFEFEVLFCHGGEVRGSVECTVHAENLTKPEHARVIVCRTMEQFTVNNIAQEMIKACN